MIAWLLIFGLGLSSWTTVPNIATQEDCVSLAKVMRSQVPDAEYACIAYRSAR
jgi:hypothetical protein